jgi:pimeloyl-ACP methyl ester carboxylesterase
MGGLYFGPRDAPLFGVYQPPLTDADRDTGVVICNPFGPEYTSSHRALRQLGIRLARAGFHLLRFDYRGSGDSSGDGEEVELDSLTADAGCAIEFLKDMAGLSKVALVGLRLGASVAALVASGRRDVERLVLWEPVISGERYLDELWAMHAGWLDGRPWIPLAHGRGDDATWEVVGYPLAPRARAGIAALSLQRLAQRPARRVLVVADAGGEPVAQLAEALRGLGATVELAAAGGAAVWKQDEDTRAIVPSATLAAIGSWLGAR